jgi:outer membrane lipoprotein-sorting protein
LNKRNPVALIAVVLALACSVLPAQAQLANIPQFSADISSKMHGGESTQGKMYFGGSKIRMDMNAGGHDMQIITDPAKQTSYMIMPQQKMYMEMNTAGMAGRGRTPEVKPVDPQNPCANQPGTTCKKVGAETVNGRSCDKWELTGQHGKKTLWIDQKLHFPIRTVSDDSTTLEMTNIKEGTQPASLFQVPAGYQKMDMGGMMRQRPEN